LTCEQCLERPHCESSSYISGTSAIYLRTDPVTPTISYDGEVVDPDCLHDPEKAKHFDVMAFLARHNKEKRGPAIFAAATALRQEHGYKRIGAVGFCYGGWAVFQLGAKGAFHTSLND